MSDQIHTPKWLIMVYISADNVLANFAVESLKQLKRAACKEVIVAAQVDINEQTGVRRYLFTGSGTENGSIKQEAMKITGPPPSARGIADPHNLTNFITETLNFPPCAAATHRCLFLWGHGYELLLDENQPGRAGADGRKYLTPKNLRQALESVTVEASPEFAKKLLPGTKAEPITLDIIGIDACAMSLIELATELKGHATYLIASQDDVPDASFPYEELLGKLKGEGSKDHRIMDNVPGICDEIPTLYQQAYQDYISAPGTGIGEITLTSLRLDAVATVTEPLTRLAAKLNRSAFDAHVGPKILKAREESNDFALGMFVDLYDFCVKLEAAMGDPEITPICDEICAAIRPNQPNGLVLKNVAGENGTPGCNGISLYFPCLGPTAIKDAQKSINTQPVPMVDNLPELAKGGTNHLIKARGLRIGEMEADFGALTEFQQTGWIEFVQQGWSYILATHQPNDLDRRYSAQQCAMNLAKIVHQPGEPEMLFRQSISAEMMASQRNDKKDKSIPAHA